MNAVLGHDAIRDHFADAIRHGRLGHAFLCVGPAGVGKKLFAHEMARALLCESSPGPALYCGTCAACALTAAGTHPDIFTAKTPEDKHELPIKAIRDLCNQLSLSPTRGLRKVAIVEDAEEFNNESANAFLKTLEEPTPWSVLFLIATSEESQLPTIRSRCQIIRFQKLPDEAMTQILHLNGIDNPNDVDFLLRLGHGVPARALLWAESRLREFRIGLANLLTNPKPSQATMAERWAKVVEEAGKETSKQRERTQAVFDLLLDWGEKALRQSLGVAVSPVDSAESAVLRALASRFDTDGLMEWLDTLTLADNRLERRVQVPLVIEWVTETLLVTQASSG